MQKLRVYPVHPWLKIMARSFLGVSALKKFSGENAFSGFLLGNRQNFGVVETWGNPVVSAKMPGA